MKAWAARRADARRSLLEPLPPRPAPQAAQRPAAPAIPCTATTAATQFPAPTVPPGSHPVPPGYFTYNPSAPLHPSTLHPLTHRSPHRLHTAAAVLPLSESCARAPAQRTASRPALSESLRPFLVTSRSVMSRSEPLPYHPRMSMSIRVNTRMSRYRDCGVWDPMATGFL